MRALPLVLLGLLCAGRLAAQEEEEPTGGPPWRTSYFPYLGGMANDGPVFAFRVRYWQPAEYEDRTTTRAALTGDAGITLRGGRFVKLQFKAPQFSNGWRLNTFVGAIREVRFGFFGLGNDAPYIKSLVTKANPFIYRVRRTRYRGLFEVTKHLQGPKGPLQVAVLGDVEKASFTVLPAQSLFRSAFGNELKETDVSGRVALVYDTRDNEYNTHKGLLLEAGAQVGSGGDGYTRLYTVLRGYLPLREGTVVAARLAASGMGGTPTLNARLLHPAWENQIPVLGGQYSHRIFDSGRFAGKARLFWAISRSATTCCRSATWGPSRCWPSSDAGRVFEQENSNSRPRA